jgi:predicted nucleotidyltransferase
VRCVRSIHAASRGSRTLEREPRDPQALSGRAALAERRRASRAAEEEAPPAVGAWLGLAPTAGAPDPGWAMIGGQVAAQALDRRSLASEVARDLRDIYGERLKDVVLYGSSARGDAQPESDIDLLVVLDEVPSRRRELARMSDVLWRHSLVNDAVVAEIPVSEAEYWDLTDPLLARVRAEGVSVA